MRGFSPGHSSAIVFPPYFVVLSLQCCCCRSASDFGLKQPVTNVSLSANLSRFAVIAVTAHPPSRESNILFAKRVLGEISICPALPPAGH
jgi:hypothetical protein